jgi:hypothetical protein
MSVLHSDNKIEYAEGDKVEIAMNGDVADIRTGVICGRATISSLIDFWIVRFDKPNDVYPFSCASVQHTFIRPTGDNRPFLCEGVPRV